MKRIKQMALSLIMAASLLGSIPLTANAATVSTSEFGTMNYSLTRSGSTVTAKTSVTKTANKLITGVEIQVNATGATVATASVTKNNAKVNDVIKVTNYSSSIKLACFSSHEARGTGSVNIWRSSRKGIILLRLFLLGGMK